MECGFRPHDRGRTTESMEGLWMGYWAVLEGCSAAGQKGLWANSVNRWSIKRTPNGTEFDGRSTGAIPRPLGKLRSIQRMFNTR